MRTVGGEIYDPGRLSEGAVQHVDLEVHLVFHDERFPMSKNRPAMFAFEYHLSFEDVVLRILASAGAMAIWVTAGPSVSISMIAPASMSFWSATPLPT